MRKRVGLAVAALMLVTAALSGCSSGGGTSMASDLPKPERDPSVDMSRLSSELNVFTWTEYLPQSVISEFEDLYGVRVNYDAYSSNEEMHAKLKAGASGYDIIIPEIYMVKVLRREGLLEEIDHANVPNLKNIDPRFRGLEHDPNNDYSVPYVWGTTGIVVNKERISPDQIQSWDDLWNPDFAGKLVVPDDAREMVGIALRTMGHGLNTTDPAALEAAKEKLKALKPNVRAFNSDSPKDLLLGGEVWGGVVWSGEAALVMREKEDFQWIIPPEGVTIWIDHVAIPKDAPHKYTAEVFINFLLDPLVSARISAEYPYGNPNKAAMPYIPAEDLANTAINPPAEWLKKAESLDDLGDEMNQLYDQIWTEVKG
ncbi:spermidine/putrescine-binding protein [Symbiobacterium terraclitae]|uniref:Spermidine/putrescine-binding protein n=1 Tax=Symbiobacterium terraclitae TaxID=557451 RepID=A0ABS4JPD1_9FIRM|nr:spermidine/putrescine ABC transporter substrate-binding protein [Symbiobacterium terraclitae]MBP2017397.1 spermidine/putrescine-binding protein [Symbiobacterium terraclitae]